MRELFYDRNPGDARVKVGSDRQAASLPSAAKLRCRRDRLFLSGRFARGEPSKIGVSIGRFTPKKLLGGTQAKRQSSSGVREFCWRSDAQMLSQIAHRSLVFLGRIFGLGHPKPSRKPSRYFPTTKPSRNCPECKPPRWYACKSQSSSWVRGQSGP